MNNFKWNLNNQKSDIIICCRLENLLNHICTSNPILDPIQLMQIYKIFYKLDKGGKKININKILNEKQMNFLWNIGKSKY